LHYFYLSPQAGLVEVFTELHRAKVDELDSKILAGHAVGAAVDDTERTTADFFVEGVESVGREGGREGVREGL